MATYVHGTGAFTTASGTTVDSPSFAVTAGNLIVCHCMLATIGTKTFSVTDTPTGNTWAAVNPALTSNATNRCQIFATRATASATLVIRMTVSGIASTDERIIVIGEFNGPTSTTPDAQNGGTGTTANPSINLITVAPSMATACVVTTGTASAGATWVDIGAQDGNDGQYKLNPGVGTVAAPFVAAASTWAETAASFADAAAATVPSPSLRRWRY